MKPSAASVLRYLESHPGGMTSQDAFHQLHCTRLAARVSDLKAAGYRIDSVWETTAGVRYARYYLVTEPVQLAAFAL